MPVQKLAVCLGLMLGAVTAGSAAQQGEKAAAKRILVRAGHVLDVKTGKISDAQTIVVVGDRIASIGPTATIAAESGDAVVDLGGMTRCRD